MEARTVQQFVERQFGSAALGDRRRTERLIRVAAALAAGGGGDNGGSITSVIRDWSQAKAAYRLLDRPEVTHETVMESHGRNVLAATAAPGDYLLIEDSTALAYSDTRGSRGLGPIGESFTRGMWVHSTLVVRMDFARQQRQILGLLGQHLWVRPVEREAGRRPSNGRGKESNHHRQERAGRESERWMASPGEIGRSDVRQHLDLHRRSRERYIRAVSKVLGQRLELCDQGRPSPCPSRGLGG